MMIITTKIKTFRMPKPCTEHFRYTASFHLHESCIKEGTNNTSYTSLFRYFLKFRLKLSKIQRYYVPKPGYKSNSA